MSKVAMKLALEALELNDAPLNNETIDLWERKTDQAITALREALNASLAEQPAQQEPVAWVCYGSNNKHDIDFFEDEIADLAVGTKLYTQAQRTWVGLSDEEIAEMWLEILGSTPPSGIHEDGLQPWRFALAIAAKLKDKNT